MNSVLKFRKSKLGCVSLRESVRAYLSSPVMVTAHENVRAIDVGDQLLRLSKGQAGATQGPVGPDTGDVRVEGLADVEGDQAAAAVEGPGSARQSKAERGDQELG